MKRIIIDIKLMIGKLTLNNFLHFNIFSLLSLKLSLNKILFVIKIKLELAEFKLNNVN